MFIREPVVEFPGGNNAHLIETRDGKIKPPIKLNHRNYRLDIRELACLPAIGRIEKLMSYRWIVITLLIGNYSRRGDVDYMAHSWLIVTRQVYSIRVTMPHQQPVYRNATVTPLQYRIYDDSNHSGRNLPMKSSNDATFTTTKNVSKEESLLMICKELRI